MKLAIVLGTRPEIIKMAPIIRECEESKLDFYVLHSGQHYSFNMDRVFFENLELSEPRYNLNVGSGTHGEQTARILMGVEKILQTDRPDVVLVEGDTNTVLAGALAAVKLGIAVGHVEAGLRSFDRSMPEEVNRVLTDHCSDFLFAPTGSTRRILLGEGIPTAKIFVTGNTIVDSIHRHVELLATKRGECLHVDVAGDYLLATVHRQENVDDPTRFRRILDGLNRVSSEFEMPVIYPVHPRAKKRIAQYGLGLDTTGLRLIEPLDYFNFLHLERNAALILTDSGGVQEEACVLRVPCVTLRNNTERPETLEVGSNMLAGTDPEAILECTRTMLSTDRVWDNPFGDGTAGKQIVEILRTSGA